MCGSRETSGKNLVPKDARVNPCCLYPLASVQGFLVVSYPCGLVPPSSLALPADHNLPHDTTHNNLRRWVFILCATPRLEAVANFALGLWV